MLLAVDVGNSNITLGAFERERLVATFRMTTNLPRTSDEYGTEIRGLLANNGISPNAIDSAIFSSVVPDIMHSLTSAVIKYFNVTPILVEPGITTGLSIATENPRQLGADRIVDAVGAYELYGGPVIVIDFGTATTFDLVDGNGVFLAGVISPGIRVSAKALSQGTAKLPEDEDQKAGIDPWKRDDKQHTGGTCIRSDRPDRIYRGTYETGSRPCRDQSGCDRRTRKDHRERDEKH